mgnify:CR=1 FL=1
MGTDGKTTTSGLHGSGKVVRLPHIDATLAEGGIKSSMVSVYLRSLLLLWELPEAVPFILQCCRASLTVSEMNFWAASEMSRILERKRVVVMRIFSKLHLALNSLTCSEFTHMRGSEASKPARFR